MYFKTYNNETILSPAKCGTRFLDETFGSDSEGIDTKKLDIPLWKRLPKLKAIIVREPLQHLESAVHTEILTRYYNDEDRDTTQPLDVDTIIDKFCYDWKGELYQKENMSPTRRYFLETTLWGYNLHEIMYKIWMRNPRKIEIVHLKDLSSYLNIINNYFGMDYETFKTNVVGIEIPEYDNKKYDFISYEDDKIMYLECKSKTYIQSALKIDLIPFIKDIYPMEWANMMNQVQDANPFYEKLINKEITNSNLF
jgi:hypothetical protein